MSNQSHGSTGKLPVNLDGLDDAFLRYIGVESETQRYIQEPYLAYFEGCRRVVDLGCGDGDFVALLIEQGHDALGVDGDSRAAQRVRDRGLPVAESNVFPWLTGEVAAVEAGTSPAWDGIFCAHLVEHLPYERVLELCHQSARILRPGGVIILATPNVAAIHAHLDGYYKHFGHVTFYHPDLLSFFLDHSGFEVTEAGANERVPSTLFFPVIRELNEHQVTVDRIEAVSGELLPQHTQIAQASSAAHAHFGPLFARFSALFTTLQERHARLGRIRTHLAGEDVRGVLPRLRRGMARLLLGPQLGGMADLAAGVQGLADELAQLNHQTAQLAELWQQSQQSQDQLNDLLARQGTLVRDSAHNNRRMEAATRSLIAQIDAPFEAYVIARKSAAEVE